MADSVGCVARGGRRSGRDGSGWPRVRAKPAILAACGFRRAKRQQLGRQVGLAEQRAARQAAVPARQGAESGSAGRRRPARPFQAVPGRATAAARPAGAPASSGRERPRAWRRARRRAAGRSARRRARRPNARARSESSPRTKFRSQAHSRWSKSGWRQPGQRAPARSAGAARPRDLALRRGPASAAAASARRASVGQQRRQGAGCRSRTG